MGPHFNLGVGGWGGVGGGGGILECLPFEQP